MGYMTLTTHVAKYKSCMELRVTEVYSFSVQCLIFLLSVIKKETLLYSQDIFTSSKRCFVMSQHEQNNYRHNCIAIHKSTAR